jgi:hypothetical protein
MLDGVHVCIFVHVARALAAQAVSALVPVVPVKLPPLHAA